MTLAASCPGGSALQLPAGRAKNLTLERWIPEESEVVRTSPDRYTAVERYRKKFPESTRSDDAIYRHFFKTRPDLRKAIPVWTAEEIAPILSAETVDNAIAEYRRLFPESTRTDPAIKREWYGIRPEKRGLVPCGRKKGGRNKAPLEGSFREKYRIPMSTKQDPKGYHNAAYICVKYNKSYNEALPLWIADQAEKKRRREEKLLKRQRRAAARAAAKHAPQKVPRKQKVKPAIAPKVTEKPVPVPAVLKSSAGFAPGDEVVHNGSKSSPHFGRAGRIVKIVRSGNSEHLMVSFGKENAILISDKFVTRKDVLRTLS